VTFDVRWGDKTLPPVWSDSVWVFVDHNDNGTMKRLLLEPGATLTETSAPEVGRVEYPEDITNDKGVWVVGNARVENSFSATVQLLTTINDVAGACVYASNYPPVGDYVAGGSAMSFTGTPMYTIELKNTADGTTSPAFWNGVGAYPIPPGTTIESFTDATGAPGIIHCVLPAAPTVAEATFCFGLPGQLQASVSGNATVVWYDAPTGGNLLSPGNVLPLTPLYNASAEYYAEAVSVDGCVSPTRTQAIYTVNNCTMGGDCPNYTAGSIDSNTTPAACAVHYTGQIGTTNYPPACVVHDAGRIGKTQ
jgi:hypothetical protein